MTNLGELETLVDQVCTQIVAAAEPELARLHEMAERYKDRPAAHRDYIERHARLYRDTLNQLTAARKPLADLAALEPRPFAILSEQEKG